MKEFERDHVFRGEKLIENDGIWWVEVGPRLNVREVGLITWRFFVTGADWRACDDPDAMVHALAADRYQRELRLFGVACTRRVWPLLSDACLAALDASQGFAEGMIAESELAAAVANAEQETLVAFTRHSTPNAREYAASAAVDASSVWLRTATNVLAATSCAASAAACAAAEADETSYDEVFESIRRAELAAQAALLRKLVCFSEA